MKYDFLDHGVLARLGALPVEARLPMVGNMAGRHRSPHRGSSVEFAEYRKYVPGDDTRRLDWKAYARSDRYYIKEFEADTSLRAYMVVDGSGSMNFRWEEGLSKVQYARQLSASLAYLLVNQGDAAGLTCVQKGQEVEIPASRRPANLENVFDSLARLNPSGETGMIQALHDLAEKVGQRALVVIFSDLFCDVEQFGDALQHLRYRKHDVAVFHLMDRQELKFEFERPHRFVDMEDDSVLVAEPNLIFEEYQAIMRDYLVAMETKCHDVHADYRLVVTDDDYEAVLSEFLTVRLPKKGKR